MEKSEQKRGKMLPDYFTLPSYLTGFWKASSVT